MEKRLIVTRADEDVANYTKITHPVIKKYAKKCKADFDILSDCKGLHKHYRILQLYDLFEDYDRIMVIDSDVLIKKSCPNLFDEVGKAYVASVFEDVGTRKADRHGRIQKANAKYGDRGWSVGYINTGVALFSKEHRDLFQVEPTWDELYMDLGFDDVFLGWRIHANGYPFYKLDPKYNFMSMWCEDPFNMSLSDAQIIHFAGMGHWPIVRKDLQIERLYNLMKHYGEI